MAKKASVYTRTGDKGKTSLYTGERVGKGSLRVEVYGTIDETDSVLGMARAFATHENVKEIIFKLQKELWLLMADVASIGAEPNVKDENVDELEHIIDELDEKLEPLNHFLVPGETKASSFLDLARTVVRRAERLMWRMADEGGVHEVDIRYLNRLSDLCFTLSRYESEVKEK